MIDYILQPGTILAGKYVIQSVIGRGGMSNVYLALDTRLRKKWAVKEISPYTCKDYIRVSETLAAEAGILTKLDHPNLPRIVDIFSCNQSMIIVMDYIQGRNLSDLLKEEKCFEEESVVDWGIELAGVLGYLHGRTPPVIYRDMKPSNIILKDDGRLMLIDFGTAREYSDTDRGDTLCLGTRGYAAPEQYGGYEQSDFRTDIYGLGVTLYHLLTGKDPSAPPYTLLPVRQIIPSASPGIEDIIDRCTRQNPDERYPGTEELKYDLCHLEESSSVFLAREKKKVAAAAVLISLAVLCFVISAVFGVVKKNRMRQLADYYLKQALYAVNDSDRMRHLANAADILPDYEKIYRTILDCYVREGSFTTAEEASIISLTNRQSPKGVCLDILRKKKPEAYCDFCYAVGLACFFDLGGRTGKCDAGRWFEAISKTHSAGFDREKRKRAKLYQRISAYYRDYIDREDQNGETKKSYKKMFDILRELNEIDLSPEDDDAAVAAAYYISKEVLMEISLYADRFLKNETDAKDLKAEIRKIDRARAGKGMPEIGSRTVRYSRFDIFRKRRSQNDYRELMKLAEDAERKIDMEERSLKNNIGLRDREKEGRGCFAGAI